MQPNLIKVQTTKQIFFRFCHGTKYIFIQTIKTLSQFTLGSYQIFTSEKGSSPSEVTGHRCESRVASLLGFYRVSECETQIRVYLSQVESTLLCFGLHRVGT